MVDFYGKLDIFLNELECIICGYNVYKKSIYNILT